MLENYELEQKPNKALAKVYCLLFSVSLATIVLSIITSEQRPRFQMRVRQQDALVICEDSVTVEGLVECETAGSNLSQQILLPYGSELIREYSLAKTRRSLVEGLEFVDETKLLLSSGSFGGFLDLVEINEEDEIEMISNTQIESQYFGEGVTSVNGKTYLLTWRARKVLVFNTTDLLENPNNRAQYEVRQLPEPLEQGWGLSHDSNGLLYMTDGTNQITVIDPDQWKIIKHIKVFTQTGQDIRNLNELEIVDNKWAFVNQFQRNTIFQFDLQNGNLVQSWDMMYLLQRQKQLNLANGVNWNARDEQMNVLNGIAWRQSTDTFFLSGRMWDTISEIRFDYNI